MIYGWRQRKFRLVYSFSLSFMLLLFDIGVRVPGHPQSPRCVYVRIFFVISEIVTAGRDRWGWDSRLCGEVGGGAKVEAESKALGH